MQERKSINYGYTRVSTKDQNEALQIEALRDHGITEIYSDKISGGKVQRPELDKLLAVLQPGDTVTVWKLDRMFRSTRHLCQLVEEWAERGIWFHCLTQPISTLNESPAAKLMRVMLSAFAEFEKDINHERSAEGIRLAKERGVKFGAPRKLTRDKYDLALSLLEQGHTMSRVSRMIGVDRRTIQRRKNKEAAA